ncbi:MAG: ComEC/Rec2 family competence protein, partial [Dehalococcoidia bacterium]|nr:ComEC/Rec2 family competence protein [Dehalococcoidia bacterium]
MPLTFIAAAFLAGVYVASLGQVAPVVEVGGLGIGIIGLIASRWTPRIRLPSLIVLAVLGGSWRYDSALQANVPSLALSAKVGQGQVELRGVVDTSPETGELRQNVRLRLTSILGDRGWAEVHGTALLFAALAPEFAYGESLEVSGKLEDPPVFEDFDYRGYLALQGINYVMQRPAISIAGQGQGFPPMALMYGLRRRFADVLGSTLPEPEASIAQGVLLGTRSAIPRRVLNDFAATGTTHILAISGYNITLIAAAIMVLATRVVGRHRASYVAALGIGLYAILAGASPSVLRATVMGLLVIVAYRLGRQNVVINALAVSAAGLLVVQPFWLWDAGFQLSYLSTVGLVFLARPLTSVLTGAAARTGLLASSLLAKVVSLLIESVSITLAATVFTLPLAAITFRTVSLVALFANVLAVPALPPIIAGSAAVAVVGLISV